MTCYQDDIFIVAKTEVECDQLLEKTLEQLEKAGVQLSREKYEFRLLQLMYLCH